MKNSNAVYISFRTKSNLHQLGKYNLEIGSFEKVITVNDYNKEIYSVNRGSYQLLLMGSDFILSINDNKFLKLDSNLKVLDTLYVRYPDNYKFDENSLYNKTCILFSDGYFYIPLKKEFDRDLLPYRSLYYYKNYLFTHGIFILDTNKLKFVGFINQKNPILDKKLLPMLTTIYANSDKNGKSVNFGNEINNVLNSYLNNQQLTKFNLKESSQHTIFNYHFYKDDNKRQLGLCRLKNSSYLHTYVYTDTTHNLLLRGIKLPIMDTLSDHSEIFPMEIENCTRSLPSYPLLDYLNSLYFQKQNKLLVFNLRTKDFISELNLDFDSRVVFQDNDIFYFEDKYNRVDSTYTIVKVRLNTNSK
ncbi:MAG TPA: hypothetical protein PLQ93_10155 [Bacteroidia bacterium]|nr:hypothetical protein [Bacteroidia bacterium]